MQRGHRYLVIVSVGMLTLENRLVTALADIVVPTHGTVCTDSVGTCVSIVGIVAQYPSVRVENL